MARLHRIVAVAIVALTVSALGLSGLVAPGAIAQNETVIIDLEPEGDNGVTGTATLTADGDQTIVTVELVGAEEGYEGHAFDSTCDDHRSATVFYAIEAVDADGFSESTFDAPFSDLTTGDFWIHMHRPAGEFGEGIACGQILYAVGADLPATGVGPFGETGSSFWLLAALVVAAGALGASRVLRVRV